MAFPLCECACAFWVWKAGRTLYCKCGTYFHLRRQCCRWTKLVSPVLGPRPFGFLPAPGACPIRARPQAFQWGSCWCEWRPAVGSQESRGHWSSFSSTVRHCRSLVWNCVVLPRVSETRVFLLRWTTPRTSHLIGWWGKARHKMIVRQSDISINYGRGSKLLNLCPSTWSSFQANAPPNF